MAENWRDAIFVLNDYGFNHIVDVNLQLDSTQKNSSYYFIKHRFRETIIIPYVGITNNINFLKDKNPVCFTGDKVKCVAYNITESSIFLLEDDIQKIYNITAWEFLKIWNKQNLGMNSLTMLKMNLKKID